MKWRINVGKPYLASYEMTRLIARDYVEAAAMTKMLLDLLARSDDKSMLITIEPYLEEEKAPDGEHQEHGEEKKPEGKSFEMMITREEENGNDLRID